MKLNIKLGVIATLVLLMGTVLVACGDSSPSADPSGPSGSNLIRDMETAIRNVPQSHYTVAFQMATAAGGVEGTAKVWAKQAGMQRIEITSQTDDLNGVISGNNGSQGWVLTPKQQTLYVSQGEIGAPHLRNQPEVSAALRQMTLIQEEGLSNTEATLMGSEQVNGRDTYKVQVKFPNNEDLSNVDILFWIDKETSLPQKAEVSFRRGALTARGVITLQGDMAQTAVDEQLFAVPALPAGYLQANLEALVDVLSPDGEAPEGPAPTEQGADEGVEGTEGAEDN